MESDISLELYYSPGACSRVCLIALEEAGAQYTTHRVLLASGDHKQASFQKLNPKGKVPVLVVGRRVLTENIAILTFLAQRYRHANLLPIGKSWTQVDALSFLAWCASGLHPLVTRLRLPQRFCDLPGAADRVRSIAREEMIAQLAIAERRLEAQAWILGDKWSVADAYIFWVWARCPESGIDTTQFPMLRGHEKRSLARPAVRRALAREAMA